LGANKFYLFFMFLFLGGGGQHPLWVGPKKCSGFGFCPQVGSFFRVSFFLFWGLTFFFCFWGSLFFFFPPPPGPVLSGGGCFSPCDPGVPFFCFKNTPTSKQMGVGLVGFGFWPGMGGNRVFLVFVSLFFSGTPPPPHFFFHTPKVFFFSFVGVFTTGFLWAPQLVFRGAFYFFFSTNTKKWGFCFLALCVFWGLWPPNLGFLQFRGFGRNWRGGYLFFFA